MPIGILKAGNNSAVLGGLMSRRFSFSWVLLIIHLTQSCATLPVFKNEAVASDVEQKRIRIADDNTVKNCEFLGNIRGTSHFGGKLGGERGLLRAKSEATEQAKSMGATHIVWGNSHVTDGNGKT